VTVASKREPTTHRSIKIPTEHESLRQRFIHADLLKAREYAWPEVAQRIMNYYQELLDERGSSSMRPRSRAL